MTNALKAGIIVAVNIALQLAVSFGLPLTDTQQGLIAALVNALLGIWVALTYKSSPRRLPDRFILDDRGIVLNKDFLSNDFDLREPMA